MSAPVKEVPQIEAIKYALRQSKDGTVVSFVIHPNDVDHALQCLPIGSRVMFGWYEITDNPVQDAEPVNREPKAKADGEAEQSVQIRRPEPRPKRKFSEMSLPEQCGVRCEDGRFGRFMREVFPGRFTGEVTVAEAVRGFLGVTSRAELSRDHTAANVWRQLETRFQQWLTDETHGGSLNR